VWEKYDFSSLAENRYEKKKKLKGKKKSENRSASSFEYIIFLSKREDKL